MKTFRGPGVPRKATGLMSVQTGNKTFKKGVLQFRTTKGIKKNMSSYIFTEKRYKKEKVYTKPKEFGLHIIWKEHPA